jgi:hypothetical protein
MPPKAAKAEKVTKPKAEKKEKKPRAPSSYIIFSNEQRAKVQEENPGAKFGEIGKLLGAKWSALSAAEKAVTILILF